MSALLIVTNGDTRATLTRNILVRNVLLHSNVDVTLGSYTMFVQSIEHNLEDINDFTVGVTNQVDDYSHIFWTGFSEKAGSQLLFE